MISFPSTCFRHGVGYTAMPAVHFGRESCLPLVVPWGETTPCTRDLWNWKGQGGTSNREAQARGEVEPQPGPWLFEAKIDAQEGCENQG